MQTLSTELSLASRGLCYNAETQLVDPSCIGSLTLPDSVILCPTVAHTSSSQLFPHFLWGWTIFRVMTSVKAGVALVVMALSTACTI